MWKVLVEKRSYILAFIAGSVLLAVPLLKDFHLESAIAVSLIGCFWAGWQATKEGSYRSSELERPLKILLHLYLLGLPLFVNALYSGCLSIHGFGFWILYPVPSVFFGYAIGRLFRKWNVHYAGMLTFLVLLAIAAGTLAVELLSLPQVYFYNHVWGGWPGPLYDEVIHLSGSVFYYRGITALWILIFWFVPQIGEDHKSTFIVAGSAIALMFSYLYLAEAGVISPNGHIQSRLGGQKSTAHFNIYYDRERFSNDEINRIALEHEFYLEQIRDTLRVEIDYSVNKIDSYLYGHPWQKKRLVGAKFTSYVPVWLKDDQLHIAKEQIKGSLEHEMVHVISKQFGSGILNASWSIGLVEGLATALAPDRSATSTIDQMVVAGKQLPSPGEMEEALGFRGFYGGRSAVNYTTTGSFVSYLLNKYPVRHFKKAYRSADIPSAYGISLRELVEGWHRSLDTVKVDSVDRRTTDRLYGQPSLFEQACPHVVSEFAEKWDQYHYYKADGDTSRALQVLEEAFNVRPEKPDVKTEWAYEQLKRGQVEKVQFESSREDSSIELQLLYADAFAMTGNDQLALGFVSRAAYLLNNRPNALHEEALATRTNSFQWQQYMDLTYRNRLFEPESYKKTYYRTKIRALQKAMEQQQWDLVVSYGEVLAGLPADTHYSDTYLELIHLLGYHKQFELADRWITKLEDINLRSVHKQQLQEEREWIYFLKLRLTSD